MANNLFAFSDVDFQFQFDLLGNPLLKYNVDCINQSVQTILSTLKGERIMNPDFGSNIPLYVFEPINAITSKLIQNDIQNALTQWEPRITLQAVNVIPVYEQNSYTINVAYIINTLGGIAQFNAQLVTQGQ